MKLPPWEAVEVEVQVAEEEAEVEEEMEASLLPGAKTNQEAKEEQGEDVEEEVAAGRAKVEEAEQHPTGGMKPSNHSSLKKRTMGSTKALVSLQLEASGVSCHEGSQVEEEGEPGGGKMAVEAAPQG